VFDNLCLYTVHSLTRKRYHSLFARFRHIATKVLKGLLIKNMIC